MSGALLAEPDVRSGVKQFLVFPDVQELIPAKTIRLIDFRILIEFESGLIGSFHTARRQIPDPTEFFDLDHVLHGMSEKYQTAGYASQVAVDEYGLDVEFVGLEFHVVLLGDSCRMAAFMWSNYRIRSRRTSL